MISLSNLKKSFPNAYSYLLNNRIKLEKRRDSRNTYEGSNDWYSLTRFGQIETFIKSEKIVFPGEQRSMKFGINKNKAGYSGARVFSITLKNNKLHFLYLLGILNSKLCEFYIHSSFPLKQGNYYSVSSNHMDQLPISLVTETESEPLITLVNSLLAKNQKEITPENKLVEKKIDLIVYKIYNLNYSEACIIEGNTEWMTQEAYDKYTIEN